MTARILSESEKVVLLKHVAVNQPIFKQNVEVLTHPCGPARYLTMAYDAAYDVGIPLRFSNLF